MIDGLPVEILVRIAHYTPSPLNLADPGWLHEDLFLGFPKPAVSLLDFIETYEITVNEKEDGFVLNDGPLHEYFDGFGESAPTGLSRFSCEIVSLLYVNKVMHNKLEESVPFMELLRHMRYALLAESHAKRWYRRKVERAKIEREREVHRQDYTDVGCGQHWCEIEEHFMTSAGPNCACWICLAYKYPPDNEY